MTSSLPPFPLSPEWLRQRCAVELGTPLTEGDGGLWRPGRPLRPAAVLLPIFAHEDGLRMLFTVRTDHLYDHAGQISFPGGRTDDVDRNAEDTALRESSEEIGLAPEAVEILGTLHDYVTVTGYRVTPVVGLVADRQPLRLDPFEVAQVFEVPLDFLLNPRNHQRNLVLHQGKARYYYSISFGLRYIWGATAGMLLNFCSHLGVRARFGD